MLHGIHQLRGLSLIAADGTLGSVKDAYFDDEQWVVRHLVVDTAGLLGKHKVLISPLAVERVAWDERAVHVNLSRHQVESSPGIDTAKPVSRQEEVALHDHYGYPYYWTGPFIWGATVFPSVRDREDRPSQRDVEGLPDLDPHLRSANEVDGYAIKATDGELGEVEDFLFSEEDWKIQLIVIDPVKWWPGKHVLVAPERIDRVNWAERQVVCSLTRDEIRNSPDYESMNSSAPAHDLFRWEEQAHWRG